jgi:hypothetical protein
MFPKFSSDINIFTACIIAFYLKMMDYRVDGRGSIPAIGKIFFLFHAVQTGSSGPPSLLSNGFGGAFPGGKATGT